MNITEIVDDNITEIIDNITTLYNHTNDNENLLSIEITPIYLIIAVIPCAISIICCLSFLSISFIKVLINKK